MSGKLSQKSEQNADAAYTSTLHQPDVLQAGPVTIHRPAALKPMKRVWMEISAEMLTTYPRGDEAGRVRPLRSLLRRWSGTTPLIAVSSIRKLEPLEQDSPCEFHLTFETHDGLRQTHFTVDTEVRATIIHG